MIFNKKVDNGSLSIISGNCKTVNRWLAKPGERTCNECKMYNECVKHEGSDRHYNNCKICKSFQERENEK